MSDNDDKQIRELVERWAAAVHAGDLETVLADHSPDIVMFDVPPPVHGIRGIDAYRDAWPPFFAWQARGASFEITSLEVVAGTDVAFAYALLRCGMPQDDPASRLRLTLGLVKEEGRWVVSHEHHSFPDGSASAHEEIRALHRHWFDSTAARDLDGLMEHIADDVVSYEHDEPLRYTGIEAVREVCEQGLVAAPDQVGWDVPEMTVLAGGDLAVAWGLNRMTAQDQESWSRGTRVFQRRAGGWKLVHQHLSYPADPATGKAGTDLLP